jgi:hypothetical protein
MLKNLSSSFPIPFPFFLHGLKTPLHPLYRGDLSSIPYSVGPTHSLPCPALGRTTPRLAPPPRRPRRLSLPSPLRGRGSRRRPLLRRAARPPAPPRTRRRRHVEPAHTAGGQHLSGSGHETKIRSFFSTNGDESAHRADGSGKRRDGIRFSAAARSSFFFVARPVRPRGALVALASARRPRPGRRRGSSRRRGWSTAADCRRC